MKKFLIFLLAAAAVACNDSNNISNPPGGNGGSLTTTNSTPASGNGTFTSMNVVHLTNQGITNDMDSVEATQTSSGTAHVFLIFFDPSNSAIQSVQHTWGPSGGATVGSTMCGGGVVAACDTSRVSVNQNGKTINFTGLTLFDTTGGTATSTLRGKIHW